MRGPAGATLNGVIAAPTAGIAAPRRTVGPGSFRMAGYPARKFSSVTYGRGSNTWACSLLSTSRTRQEPLDLSRSPSSRQLSTSASAHYTGRAVGPRRRLEITERPPLQRHSFATTNQTPPKMYTASSAFFEALWELGVTHCFVNLGSDHPSIIEAMVKGQREKNFPQIITCPNEVHPIPPISYVFIVTTLTVGSPSRLDGSHVHGRRLCPSDQ